MAARTESVTAQKPRQPVMATQATGATHPHLDVAPPFYLVFHPERWTVMSGKLIPAFLKFPLAAGVNNVSVDRDGRINFSRARAKLEEMGRREIPWEWAPDSVSYLKCVDTRPGGSTDIRETWMSCWEDAGIGARDTSTDEEAYAEWAESLVTSGKLPPCDPSVVRRMLERATERWEKSKSKSHKEGDAGPAHIRAGQLAEEVKVLQAVVNAHKTEKAKAKAVRTPKIEA